jgi:hypothetical protein
MGAGCARGGAPGRREQRTDRAEAEIKVAINVTPVLGRPSSHSSGC